MAKNGGKRFGSLKHFLIKQTSTFSTIMQSCIPCLCKAIKKVNNRNYLLRKNIVQTIRAIILQTRGKTVHIQKSFKRFESDKICFLDELVNGKKKSKNNMDGKNGIILLPVIKNFFNNVRSIILTTGYVLMENKIIEWFSIFFFLMFSNLLKSFVLSTFFWLICWTMKMVLRPGNFKVFKLVGLVKGLN